MGGCMGAQVGVNVGGWVRGYIELLYLHGMMGGRLGEWMQRALYFDSSVS